jgi:hypothetical protein
LIALIQVRARIRELEQLRALARLVLRGEISGPAIEELELLEFAEQLLEASFAWYQAQACGTVSRRYIGAPPL